MNSLQLRLLDGLALLTFVWLVYRVTARYARAGPPFSPGPKPHPLLGNLLQMPIPSRYPWVTFWEWGQRWGPVVSIGVLGQRFVILNSAQAAIDLFDKRGAIYSDRQRLWSADVIGWSRLTPVAPYNDVFREHRRMMSRTIGSRALVEERLQPLQVYEVHRFLMRLLEDPGNFVRHIERTVTSVTYLVTHGYVVQDGDDAFMNWIHKAAMQFSDSLLPGAFLVDMIPALKYWPSWLPDSGWRRRISSYMENLHLGAKRTLSWTKVQMGNGTNIPSFISKNLEEDSANPTHEDEVMWASVGLLGGGADTTLSTIHSFFLAMVLYPDVQRLAQAEIDAVVGNDRLPSYDDRDRLPYVNAVCSELFRWLPVIPLGIPHRLMQNDYYNGYFIPEGSICIANLWGLTHDPEVYKDPMEFKPERFVASESEQPEPDPRAFIFGFGRRICPGNHVADSMVFITVAHLLAAFTILKAVENGKEITPPAIQTSSHLSHPVSFKCFIQPRSTRAEALVRSANEDNQVPEVWRD